MACRSWTGFDVFTASSPGIPSFGDLSWHAPVRVATTAALPANTFAAGVITATGNGTLTVDGKALVAGYRVLVKDEAAQSHNGIYDVTAPGDASHPFVLTRAADANTSLGVQAGSCCWSTGGNVNNKTLWVQTSTGSATEIPVINSDNLTYSLIVRQPNNPIIEVVTTYIVGTNTWNIPTNCIGILVEVVGGGGGGGGGAAAGAGAHTTGGGGGGGAWARKWLPIGQLSGSYIATVGGGALGGGAGANTGGTGWQSSFVGTNANVVAGGGVGGSGSSSTTATFSAVLGGLGGANSGGDIGRNGDRGEAGMGGAGLGKGGDGGDCLYGAGGGGGNVTSSGQSNGGGNAPAGNGGGGGGGASASTGAAAAGGTGSNGIVIVHEFYPY